MKLAQVLITCSLSNASTSMKTESQRFRWEVLGFHSIRVLQLHVFTKGLSNLVALSNLNLSNNYISRLCQLACLPNLHTLNIAKSVTEFYLSFSFQHNYKITYFYFNSKDMQKKVSLNYFHHNIASKRIFFSCLFGYHVSSSLAVHISDNVTLQDVR